MIVKICGLTNAEDALAALDAGAGVLGFVFYPGGPRYVRPEHAARIFEQLPPGTVKAGVFVNERAASIERTAAALRLDIAQLVGHCDTPSGIRVWRCLRVGDGFRPELVEAGEAEAVVLDTPSATLYGGTGRTWDWKLARGLRHRVIVAGGLDASNVERAIHEAQPWGVDASSRLERAPGLKDHRRVRAFVQAALAAAAALT